MCERTSHQPIPFLLNSFSIVPQMVQHIVELKVGETGEEGKARECTACCEGQGEAEGPSGESCASTAYMKYYATVDTFCKVHFSIVVGVR